MDEEAFSCMLKDISGESNFGSHHVLKTESSNSLMLL
jgi:hypothetical protein